MGEGGLHGGGRSATPIDLSGSPRGSSTTPEGTAIVQSSSGKIFGEGVPPFGTGAAYNFPGGALERRGGSSTGAFGGAGGATTTGSPADEPRSTLMAMKSYNSILGNTNTAAGHTTQQRTVVGAGDPGSTSGDGSVSDSTSEDEDTTTTRTPTTGPAPTGTPATDQAAALLLGKGTDQAAAFLLGKGYDVQTGRIRNQVLSESPVAQLTMVKRIQVPVPVVPML